jgi:DNA polymerase-3 subunit alpha
MLFVQIQNPLETMEVTVFPRIYQETQEIWLEDIPVFIKGKVNIRDGEVSLLVDQVAVLTEGNLNIIKDNLASNKAKKSGAGSVENKKNIVLRMEEVPAPDLAYKLKEIFETHPGNNPVFLSINGKMYPTKTTVANHNILEIKITTLLGKNSFIVK